MCGRATQVRQKENLGQRLEADLRLPDQAEVVVTLFLVTLGKNMRNISGLISLDLPARGALV